MAYKDIKPGKYLAKARAARFVKPKEKLGLEVSFQFMQDGVPETINNVFWLSPDAIERSMETLVLGLGFNGDDEVVPGTSNLKPGAIDPNKEVELDIQYEEYQGKAYPRVKFVNIPGREIGFKAAQPETIRAELSAIGFKAAFNMMKGKTAPAKPAAPIVANEPIPLSEVPF